MLFVPLVYHRGVIPPVDRDIYFVSTPKHHSFDAKAAFRVTGKTPRLWHPESGETEAVTFTTDKEAHGGSAALRCAEIDAQ